MARSRASRWTSRSGRLSPAGLRALAAQGPSSVTSRAVLFLDAAAALGIAFDRGDLDPIGRTDPAGHHVVYFQPLRQLVPGGPPGGATLVFLS